MLEEQISTEGAYPYVYCSVQFVPPASLEKNNQRSPLNNLFKLI